MVSNFTFVILTGYCYMSEPDNTLHTIPTLTAQSAGVSLLPFLALRFPAVPLAQLQRAVREGQVRVDGRVVRQAAWVVPSGSQVSWRGPLADIALTEPAAPLTLEILYEDADLLICDKPAGMLSHPSPQEKSGTLLHAAAHYILQQGGPSAQRPFLLHRLDRDTSGVIALARHERAAQILTRDFAEKRARKQYLALVKGIVNDDSGTIDAAIAPTPHLWPRWRVAANGAPAQTRFTIRERFPRHTLLSLEPLTGRTHQLRLHCAHIGHPIAGEKVYRGIAKPARTPGISFLRTMLHAERLTLPHPTQTGRLVAAAAPLPADLTQALAAIVNCEL